MKICPLYNLITILMLLIPPTVNAAEWFSPLTPKDYAYIAADTALLAADWSQTRRIAAHPDTYYEHNSILGRHPSAGRVNAYFALAELSYVVTAKAIPASWRPYFHIGLAVVEAANVTRNAKLGLGLGFSW